MVAAVSMERNALATRRCEGMMDRSLDNPMPLTPPHNRLGVAGFALSVLGLLTLGVLSPLGLLVSALALSRRPRGFAVAGTIIGAAGSIALIIAAWLVIASLLGPADRDVEGGRERVLSLRHLLGDYAKESVEEFETTSRVRGEAIRTIHEAMQQIVNTYDESGSLPSVNEGNELIRGVLDPWGGRLRYSRIDDGRFAIRSNGPDGEVDTADDIVYTCTPEQRVEERHETLDDAAPDEH
jgi:hypothetical protein